MARVTFLMIIYFIFIFVTQAISKQNFLRHFCQDDRGNFTTNSTYEANLNHLLSTLPSQDGNGYGFYNLSYGNSSDKVYAIGLCGGDANPEVCRACLNESTHLLTQLCPNQKEVVGWYDNCMLRYSNRSMFGVMETSPKIFLKHYINASDSEAFFGNLWILLNDLKNEAVTSGSLRKYATGNASAPDNRTIYAVVQCTPDLSLQECGSCLDDATGNLGKNCCEDKIGGRVIGPSCYFRYEEFLFYGSAYDPLPASPPMTISPTQGKGSNISRIVIIIAVVIGTVVSALLILFVYVYLRKSRAKKIVQTRPLYKHVEEFGGVESLQYSFDTIRIATNDFSESNKLGQGGFGSVYKGRFSDGRDIAVKRLSKDSGQEDLQFNNEVLLVAKLHHRNLVRLLGFCSERNERILLYEFVPNTSLDHFIFDPSKRTTLDWNKRFKIIGGVARGLLYLHEDSQLRIIHRDLKANNILLDENMEPKISDFGMARFFEVDQTEGNTSQIVGTYGYMAPEYVTNGQFSVKSDVFSFGVLLLEIVSGQKTTCFSNIGEHGDQDLLSYAWTSWREGNASNIVDPQLRPVSRSEVMRCIHIALLCVQENIAHRPNMNTVVLMLGSSSLSLPVPLEPGFFIHSNINRPVISLASDSNNPRVQNESGHSNNDSARASANEDSITEVTPR